MRDVGGTLRKIVGVKLSDLDAIAKDLSAQLGAIHKSVENLQSQVNEARTQSDAFAAFLYRARRAYRRECACAKKSGNNVQRQITRSFFDAKKFGYTGSGHDWEALLRVRAEEPEA
jgi:hypothetical protein